MIFLVGLGLGYLLGAGQDVANSPRALRNKAEPESTSPMGRSASGSEEESAQSSKPVTPASVDPVSGQPHPPPGIGTLELNWAGFGNWEKAELEGFGLTDKRQQYEVEPQEEAGPIRRLRLWVGEYVLRVRAERDLSDRVWKIRIEPDHVTRIDLAADAEPERYEIPPGFGRLDLQVFDVARRPLEHAAVEVVGVVAGADHPKNEAATATNEAGRARLHLRPGAYRLRIGGFESSVFVRLGATTELSIPHDRHAELHVTGPGHPRLVPLDDPSARWWAYSRGETKKFCHVVAGRYRIEVVSSYRVDGVPVATVVLRAGVRQEIEIDPPRGHLTIGLQYESGVAPDWSQTSLRLVPVVGGKPIRLRVRRAGQHFVENGRRYYRAVTPVAYLEPGRYRVEFRQQGWQDATEELNVQGSDAQVTLRLRRA